MIEMTSMPESCPYCGSPRKYPTKVETRYKMRYEYPTTFSCGTVTSPNWPKKPGPIRGDYCKD